MDIQMMIGIIGTALAASAYLPQIHHLIKEHCSAGISPFAFTLWFIASGLFLIRALTIHDPIFTALLVVQCVCSGLILGFALKYRNQSCVEHQLKTKSASGVHTETRDI